MTSDNHAGQTVDGSIVRQENPDQALAVIEGRNKLMDRLLDAALRATHSGQWVDQQGKPFPTAAAAEVMARRCGVSIFDVESKREERSDDKGNFYIYVTKGKARLVTSPFDVIETFGTCSSRDQFLGTETGAGRQLSDIDEGNIMKASYSNFTVNATTRLLGVRGMTWEQLKPFGITIDGAVRVSYADGAKGGGTRDAGTDAASSIIIKFGKGEGKSIADQTDDNLAWYISIFEKDLTSDDPKKLKYKANTEKSLAAAKAEKEKRAKAKAEKDKPSVWERLKTLATALTIDEAKLKVFTKKVLQKDTVNPAELTEENFTAIANELEADKAKSAAAPAGGAPAAGAPTSSEQKAGW